MAKYSKKMLLEERTPHDTVIAPEHSQNITAERLQEMLPKGVSMKITDEILSLIHNAERDTNVSQEALEQDIMSYMPVLGTIKGVGMRDYVNAIKYQNLARTHTNQDAWSIVFPEKYKRLVDNGQAVANHVSAYNNSKLVVAIGKEMLIPVHIQYSGIFHAAIQKQYELMMGKTTTKDKYGNDDKVSPMVQHLAAKELAVLTRQPEESKLSIELNPSEEAKSMQQQMNDQLSQLVSAQRKRLEEGDDILDVQVIGIDFSDIGKDNG